MRPRATTSLATLTRLALAKMTQLTLALFVLAVPAWTQQEQPTSETIPTIAKLWVDGSATVTPKAMEEALEQVARQEHQPQDIVVLIHGYDMGQEESSRLYDALGEQVRRGLSPDRVAMVGVQWDSGGGNFINPSGDYFQTLSRARDVGRGPVRQLLLGLQDRYPNVPVTVLTHSMGCEITLAAVVPEMPYTRSEPKSGTYEAQRELHLAMAVLAASDLDYDVWYRGGDPAQKWFDRCGLTWSTVTDPSSQGDKVLSLRSRIRGKASGSLLPRMTEGQLDRVISSRRFYLDGRDVPSNHALDSYYSAARIGRILGVLKYLTRSEAAEPEELAALRRVLEAPDDLTVLLPMLDSVYTGAGFYALWRVERLNCGDARHMADQTLEKAVLLMADKPQAIWREQAHSECVTMRKGQFPTDKMMSKAGAPPFARPGRYNPVPR